ncbi:MAG: 3-oxoacyl-[acyl-carrier protein] reductase [Oleiphilaceae bacterium]|jgi:3-oxoacyl-[acyl-carrier protein] reductase
MINDTQKNTNKIVWLTGSASGIGLHLTDLFQKLNYQVIATDINEEAMHKAATEKKWHVGRMLIRKLNVCQKESWQLVFDEAIERFGKIDIFLNIAGYVKPGFLLETPLEELDKHIDVNLKGAIYGCHIIGQQMLKQSNGHIINIASLAGIAPVPGMGYYSTSKLGIRGYSLILAQELRDKGISVSVVCPDLIKTPMYDLQLDYEKESALVFSGVKLLTVNDISDAIFNTVLPKKPFECTLPRYRGWLATFTNAFPALAYHVSGPFKRIGEAKIRKAKQSL